MENNRASAPPSAPALPDACCRSLLCLRTTLARWTAKKLTPAANMCGTACSILMGCGCFCIPPRGAVLRDAWLAELALLAAG